MCCSSDSLPIVGLLRPVDLRKTLAPPDAGNRRQHGDFQCDGAEVTADRAERCAPDKALHRKSVAL
jgi:hypothetical protein